MATSNLKSTELEFKNSEGNSGKLQFDTDENLSVNRPLVCAQGIACNSISVSSNGAVTAASIENPKRWAFGKTRAYWYPGSATPTNQGFTVASINSGSGTYYDTTSTTHNVVLTNSTQGQKGVIYKSLANYDNWELRAVVRVVPSNSDGDGFWIFGNCTSGTGVPDTDNSEFSGGGYAAYIHRYSSNGAYFRIFNGTTELYSKTEIVSAVTYDSAYHTYSFRRIGTKLYFTVGASGSAYPPLRYEVTDSGSQPSGTNYGVGAMTGDSVSWQIVGGIEIRSLSEDSSVVTDEVD